MAAAHGKGRLTGPLGQTLRLQLSHSPFHLFPRIPQNEAGNFGWGFGIPAGLRIEGGQGKKHPPGNG